MTSDWSGQPFSNHSHLSRRAECFCPCEPRTLGRSRSGITKPKKAKSRIFIGEESKTEFKNHLELGILETRLQILHGLGLLWFGLPGKVLKQKQVDRMKIGSRGTPLVLQVRVVQGIDPKLCLWRSSRDSIRKTLLASKAREDQIFTPIPNPRIPY